MGVPSQHITLRRWPARQRVLRLITHLGAIALLGRAWWYRRWLKGLLETLISAVFAFRFLPFRREILRTANGQEYSVWWPRKAVKAPERCWVLLPGGMSNGRDFYITSLGTSSAIAANEAWVVFHNPGQGGSKVRSLDDLKLGLTRTDCLSHFLEQLRAQFRSLVVVGFSAGGMAAMAQAQKDDPIADAFVSVCTPDKIRLVFEAQARMWCRLDVFFSIWLHLCAQAAGTVSLVPFRSLPLPPTWWGYMKPFTEKVFEFSTGKKRTFEEIEDEHFDGSLKRVPIASCLRIWCVDDPVVLCSTLARERFCHSEVWWETRGGHCGQFYWSRDCVQRLRDWVLKATSSQVVKL
mmetsp:Transcript_6478/g.12448  ORF Transcript_6478/g.12448 Transcript_6478/m.12448 type:complete len:350 (-) Transcript_6478:99-1148(-)